MEEIRRGQSASLSVRVQQEVRMDSKSSLMRIREVIWCKWKETSGVIDK